MKNFRVSLTYNTNGHAACISSVVPAYNDDQAILKITNANSLADQVTASKVERLTDEA